MQIEVKIIGTSSEDAKAIATAVLSLGTQLPSANEPVPTPAEEKPVEKPQPKKKPAPTPAPEPEPTPEPATTPGQEETFDFGVLYKQASTILANQTKKADYKDELRAILSKSGCATIPDLQSASAETLKAFAELNQRYL